ncbi:MAG: T9SS type A sorting domain-containing protein [Cyclobacteriaceae bacterium]|nr:T9SS type A sorting domain-containing protein [Cyclobacteriaceae bacterium]
MKTIIHCLVAFALLASLEAKAQVNQTITFNLTSTAIMGAAPITLMANSTSRLPVEFTSSNPEIAEVQLNKLIIKRMGRVNITATQPGNASFNPATPVVRPFTIYRKEQTITFGALPAKIVGEQPFVLTASASSGLPVSFSSSNGSVAMIDGNKLVITGSGTATITARQMGDVFYNPAVAVPQTFTVQGFDGYRLMVATGQGGSLNGGTILSMNLDGTQQIVNNNLGGSNGSTPNSTLSQTSNGEVFGTTYLGGLNNSGVIFKIKPDGTGFTKLHDFDNIDGATPNRTKIVEAPNGELYSTTYYGGSDNKGVIYKIRKDGTGFTKLFEFNGSNGSFPNSLIFHPNGNLYGTTNNGGVVARGVIYKIKQDGSGFTKLFDFSYGNGVNPIGNLIVGLDGYIYGTTSGGGSLGYGVIFRINSDGSNFNVIFNLGGNYGGNPIGGLLQSSDGYLYGTTSIGGANDLGVIYRILPDGSDFSVLHNFNAANGAKSSSNLVEGGDGYLYGTTDVGGINNSGVVFKIRKDGTDYTKFDLTPNFGTNPYGAPLLVTAQSGTAPDIYVKSPADLAVGVNISFMMSVNMMGTTNSYTIELNSKPNFTGTPIVFNSTSPYFTAKGLTYGTTYYARAKTNRNPKWGKTTMFTTGLPEIFAYVETPTSGAVNQNINTEVKLHSVAGATNYTVELNTDPNFSAGTALVQSGTTLSYMYRGLQFNKMYYTRVKTNLSPNWGPIKSFTTAPAQALSYIMANNVLTNTSWLPTLTVNSIGATSYTVELSPVSNFSSGIVSATSSTPSVTFTTPLAYNTKYYGRVTSNLAPGLYGLVRELTTGSPAGYSFMRSPANNSLNVRYITAIASNPVPGVTSYTVEANPDPAFGAGTAIVKTGMASQLFSLAQDTKYYVRISTNLSPGEWGITSSFTTGNNVSLAFVMTPRNNATGVSLNPTVAANTLTGVTSYEVELNLASDFSGTPIVRKGAPETKYFSGLLPGTIYYARVRTNLTGGVWGPTTRFTTVLPSGRVATEEEVPMEQERITLSDQIDLTVYPVPTRDYFNVHVQSDTQQDVSLKIMDMMGRELHQSAQRTNSLISVGSELPSGMYLLMVRTNTGTKAVKVMKVD